jgi:vancomycin resistance protein YoaR
MGSLRRVLNIILFVFSLIVLFFCLYNLTFLGKIFLNISVAGVRVSGLDINTASQLLSEKIKPPEDVSLVYQDQTFELLTKDIDLSYDFPVTARKAFNLVRTGNIGSDLVSRARLLFYPADLGIETKFDETKLQKFISVVAGEVSREPVSFSIKVVKGSVVVNKGIAGSEVDQNVLQEKIKEELSFASNADIFIPIKIVDNTLDDTEVDSIKIHAEKFLGKKVIANSETGNYTISDTDILNFLDSSDGFDSEKINTLMNKVANVIDRDPQNPKFIFQPAQTGDSGKVTEFQPALEGISLDREKFSAKLTEQLTLLENSNDKSESFDIPVNKTPPDITTDKVNNLGIKQLIGRGTSTFFHSIPGRVYNVVLASSRINGTLVKPGDTFSFNDTLGDVSAFTGYQQAYIISGGKTILGDGGGVCQVSTTLFRAILNAGLPVVERAAHAYRVGYYEQDSPPGLDATVYGPSPDLKFTNDTPGYILIEATANPKNYSLVFELYGTSDGRAATISKPVVTNVTPALPTVYQDDPTLPTGTLKQTDFSAAGATVTFNYFVKRGDEIIFQKTFVSNYRPWAAVYLRGTGPAI